MKKIILAIAVVVAAGISGCSSHKVADIKAHATETFEKSGFKVVGYEGYQAGSFETYGGKVWYIIERNGVTYHAYLSEWNGEYHIYNLKALDAGATLRVK